MKSDRVIRITRTIAEIKVRVVRPFCEKESDRIARSVSDMHRQEKHAIGRT
jgi:hypothetical protein